MKFNIGDRVRYNGQGGDYWAPTSTAEGTIKGYSDWKPLARRTSTTYEVSLDPGDREYTYYLAEEDLTLIPEVEPSPIYWVTVNGEIIPGGFDTHEEACQYAYDEALVCGNACVLQVVDRYDRKVSVARSDC
jgi:hypothetical protein